MQRGRERRRRRGKGEGGQTFSSFPYYYLGSSHSKPRLLVHFRLPKKTCTIILQSGAWAFFCHGVKCYFLVTFFSLFIIKTSTPLRRQILKEDLGGWIGRWIYSTVQCTQQYVYRVHYHLKAHSHFSQKKFFSINLQ